MIEIDKIASNLQCGEHGIWVSSKQSDISYPDDGNIRCFEIERHSFWFEHRNRCIIESMRLFPPEGAILDVGGGNGYVSLAIKNAGFEPIVIEPGIQGAMNAYARGLNPVICSTLEDAGFKDQSIPSAGLFDIMEHIEDDVGFLRSIRNLLIESGRLYITVPAYKFLWSNEDEQAGHYRRYTTKSLKIILESVGFEVDLSTYIFGLLPIPIFFIRSIPSRLGLRAKRGFRRTLKEHRRKESFTANLLKWAFNNELKALRDKKPIPFGGSCLVAARVSL